MEAKFEFNSYGFRPGRSTHDAITAVYNNVRHVPKYIVTTDPIAVTVQCEVKRAAL